MKILKLMLQMFTSQNPVVSANQIVQNDINNDLMLINPNFAPLISYLRNKGVVATGSTTIEWIDNYVRPVQDTINGALTDVATSVVVDDADFGINGILLQIDDEIMLATAWDEGTKTFTVTRGYAGTTAAAHSDGAEIRNLGFDNAEDAEYVASKSKIPVNIDNYTRVFTESYELSRTAQSVNAQGLGGATQLALEEEKAKQRLMGQMEYALIHGRKFKSGNKRGNDGILNLISIYGITNDAGATAISITTIEDTTELIFRAGGQAMLAAGRYAIVANTNQARKINDFNNDKVRTTRTDNTAGEIINFVDTTHGRLTILQTASFPKDQIGVVNLDDLTEKQLSAFRIVRQGTNGLVDRFQIDGETTFEMKGLPLAALITNLTK